MMTLINRRNAFFYALILHLILFVVFCLSGYWGQPVILPTASVEQPFIVSYVVHKPALSPREMQNAAAKTQGMVTSSTQPTVKTTVKQKKSSHTVKKKPMSPSPKVQQSAAVAQQGEQNNLARQLHRAIQQRIYFPDTMPESIKAASVDVVFDVTRDKNIEALRVVRSSGLAMLDDLATTVVRDSVAAVMTHHPLKLTHHFRLKIEFVRE